MESCNILPILLKLFSKNYSNFLLGIFSPSKFESKLSKADLRELSFSKIYNFSGLAHKIADTILEEFKRSYKAY